MGKLTQLTEKIQTSKNFKLLTHSYQEHAVDQISFARTSVTGSRNFADELTDIFYNVKTAYAKGQGRSLNRFFRGKKIPIAPHMQNNGKEALVLITANDNLYGDIIQRVCKLFYEKAKDSDPKTSDFIIVGRRGKDFFDQQLKNRPYDYFRLPETKISVTHLLPLTQKLLPYLRVRVFYGKFQNLLTQSPVVEESITGDIPLDPTLEDKNKEDFIFEPTREEVLSFFENQIFSILINQVVQEGLLARFASRINAMEQAQNNIQKALILYRKEQKVARIMEFNKKQLERISGRVLWSKF